MSTFPGDVDDDIYFMTDSMHTVLLKPSIASIVSKKAIEAATTDGITLEPPQIGSSITCSTAPEIPGYFVDGEIVVGDLYIFRNPHFTRI